MESGGSLSCASGGPAVDDVLPSAAALAAADAAKAYAAGVAAHPAGATKAHEAGASAAEVAAPEGMGAAGPPPDDQAEPAPVPVSQAAAEEGAEGAAGVFPTPAAEGTGGVVEALVAGPVDPEGAPNAGGSGSTPPIAGSEPAAGGTPIATNGASGSARPIGGAGKSKAPARVVEPEPDPAVAAELAKRLEGQSKTLLHTVEAFCAAAVSVGEATPGKLPARDKLLKALRPKINAGQLLTEPWVRSYHVLHAARFLDSVPSRGTFLADDVGTMRMLHAIAAVAHEAAPEGIPVPPVPQRERAPKPWYTLQPRGADTEAAAANDETGLIVTGKRKRAPPPSRDWAGEVRAHTRRDGAYARQNHHSKDHGPGGPPAGSWYARYGDDVPTLDSVQRKVPKDGAWFAYDHKGQQTRPSTLANLGTMVRAGTLPRDSVAWQLSVECQRMGPDEKETQFAAGMVHPAAIRRGWLQPVFDVWLGPPGEPGQQGEVPVAADPLLDPLQPLPLSDTPPPAELVGEPIVGGEAASLAEATLLPPMPPTWG